MTWKIVSYPTANQTVRLFSASGNKLFLIKFWGDSFAFGSYNKEGERITWILESDPSVVDGEWVTWSCDNGVLFKSPYLGGDKMNYMFL